MRTRYAKKVLEVSPGGDLRRVLSQGNEVNPQEVFFMRANIGPDERAGPFDLLFPERPQKKRIEKGSVRIEAVASSTPGAPVCVTTEPLLAELEVESVPPPGGELLVVADDSKGRLQAPATAGACNYKTTGDGVLRIQGLIFDRNLEPNTELRITFTEEDPDQVWCGRTSGCLIYNHYALARGDDPSALIVNNEDADAGPRDLMYPATRRVAAPGFDLTEPPRRIVPDGGFVGEELAPRKSPFRPRTADGQVPQADIERALRPIIESLDRNNPVLTYTGISDTHGHPRHLIVITGYWQRDGELWLRFSDPSTMRGKVGWLDRDGRPDGLDLKVDEAGRWEDWGSTWWLRAGRLFERYPHRSSDRPRMLICDYMYPPLVGLKVWRHRRGGAAPGRNLPRESPPSAHAVATPAFSLPVDLGQGTQVSAAAMAALYRHTEQQHAFGYFPVGKNTVWHGGVLLRAAPGTPVRACASGKVVAARMPDDAAKANGHWGSRSFVLIQHEDAAGEPWYSVYAHLATAAQRGAGRLEELPWLLRPTRPEPGPLDEGSGAPRAEDGFVVGGGRDHDPGSGGKFTLKEFVSGHANETDDCATRSDWILISQDLLAEVVELRRRSGSGLTVVGVHPAGTGCLLDPASTVAAFERVCTTRRGEAESKLKFSGKLPGFDACVYVSLYPDLAAEDAAAAPAPDADMVARLNAGELVRPGREVYAGDVIGWAGTYGHDDPARREGVVGWQVFSAENLRPAAEFVGWQATEQDDTSRDFIVDDPAIMALFDADRDTILDPEELTAFYRDEAKAAAMRTWAVRFCLEWGVDPAVAQRRYVERNPDVAEGGMLAERLGPYLWWNELQGVEPALGAAPFPFAWHYNPMKFLETEAARTPIVPATPDVVLPDVIEEEAVPLPTDGVMHTVVRGEYLSLIAIHYGVDSWETIYYHANNAAFRALRPDPNIIEPGDQVFVPVPATSSTDPPVVS